MTDERIERAAGAVPLAEALAAAAAVALSILGLAGVRTAALLAIATIVVGGTFLLEAGAVGVRYERLVDDVARRGEQRIRATEVGGGLAADTIAGLTGVVLGVLSILNVVPWALPPIALLAFGGGLLLGCAGARRLESWRLQRAMRGGTSGRGAILAADAITTIRLIVAIGSMALGIVALFRLAPAKPTLAGLIGVGCALLLTAASMGVPIVVGRRHAPA